MTDVKVTVYSTGPSCGQCFMTKKQLEAKGIPYIEVDVTQDENKGAHEYITEDLGYSQAPVVVVDEHDHWSGFRPDHIDRLARLNAH